MIEVENFDKISESERISLKFNEMLNCINDDTDNTSTFSVGCVIHTWYLNKKNIQVPCIGQYKCKALHSYPNLCNRAYENIKSPQSICCLCYENLGGHIHRRSRIRGKSASTCITEKLYDVDITKGLEFIGNLLIKIAQMENNEVKKNILIKTFEILLPLTSNKITDIATIPTINTSINYDEEQENIIPDKPPKFLNDFFSEMIDELYQQKMKICNIKRKKCHKLPKIIIPEETIKIVTFITSILLNLTFPHLKVWLPRILASFSHMPRLLGYFRQLLRVFHLTSHTDRYERQLAKIRMNTTDPSKRLIKGNNIWNLAIIDNIDFKEKTFKFGNIYDVTRGSSHATLRMAFQIQLPNEVKTGPEQIIELTTETSLFGMNQGIENTLTIFQQIIYELLNFKKINENFTYNTNFNAETIKREILNKLDYGPCSESPNIVILEPGSNPNSDEEILHVAEMYKKDFAMESDTFLDIVADEAIFRRLIKFREKWPYIRPLLGQWHTSKDFCSVLLVLFSSYGLLSLASRLGVRFLDKFESAIDYHSTARVLDLIWVAVGIAINIYITKKKILFSEIMNDEENSHICLKVNHFINNCFSKLN
ncbi:hypothetical protein RhiirB3_452924 [Rhizophagus irregularis]|nr:hypothetical protein RhiirB3_452924 [Rhizophagus irregularis]